MFLVLCLGQLSAGCSSLDEDTSDHLDFALPTLTWTVTTNDPSWRQAPGPDVATPNVVCSGPEALSTDCCGPPFDCGRYPFACDPTTNFCALTFDLEVAQAVDLVSQVPAIAAVRGRVFAEVALLGLTTSVIETAGLPIRSARLFIGPQDLAASSQPSATLLAPVALVSGLQAVTPDPIAGQAFSTLVRDYESPFVLLLSLHVVVPGKTAPTGEFGLTLSGQARAYY